MKLDKQPRFKVENDKIFSRDGDIFQLHFFKNLSEYRKETKDKAIYQIKNLPVGISIEKDNTDIEIGLIKRVIDWYYAQKLK